MKYLPDTNVWINFLNSDDGSLKAAMSNCAKGQIVTCSVVKAELYFGAERSKRKKENAALLDELFTHLQSIPFDDAAALQYASVRSELASIGMPIGPNDLMIASIALANQLILVTHNKREFSRVKGLNVEDWTDSTFA